MSRQTVPARIENIEDIPFNCTADMPENTRNKVVKIFYERYRALIIKACVNSRLGINDAEDVVQEMLLMYSNGQFKFDPARGSYSSFVYMKAHYCALDMRRKLHMDRHQDLEDKDWEQISDEHGAQHGLDKADEELIAGEALKRLARDTRDHSKIEILVRYVLKKEDREELAKAFHMTADNISVVKNRYLEPLQRFCREVMKDDYEGKLKLSKAEIEDIRQSLRQYMR